MYLLWNFVFAFLGLVVFVHAGLAGLWSLLYVNTTQPRHNRSLVNILGTDMCCVVEEGDKFLTAPLDQCSCFLGAEPAYGGPGYGAHLGSYSSAVDVYLVGFALLGSRRDLTST